MAGIRGTEKESNMAKVSTRKRSKLKQRIVATGAVLALLLPAGAAGAQAYQVYRYQYIKDGFGQCQAFEYRDYSWAEEFFQGKKDGPVYLGRYPASFCR